MHRLQVAVTAMKVDDCARVSPLFAPRTVERAARSGAVSFILGATRRSWALQTSTGAGDFDKLLTS